MALLGKNALVFMEQMGSSEIKSRMEVASLGVSQGTSRLQRKVATLLRRLNKHAD